MFDVAGEHLLYHGDCGGRPIFVSESKVMITGCGKVSLLDVNGGQTKDAVIQEGKTGNFAGASQNGFRFALESTQTGRFDPWPIRGEKFVIYDVETLHSVAFVTSKELPSGQSWSAFSPDGKLFVMGGPTLLSLYSLPK